VRCIPLELAPLEESGYFKLKSEDREAKTKKLVWNGCVDPVGFTALGGLSARKMSAATWFSIPKKPTRHLLRKTRQHTPRRIKNFNPKDVT
jgi:hypothetical protein